MKPSHRQVLALIAALVLGAVLPVPIAAQRQLHWSALDVDASLDEAGVLHVTEYQTIVFTGDWNGGERIFNLRPRQELRIIGVDRVDPATGVKTPLTEDSYLDAVDEYTLTDAHTLRWRSRLPSDPEFKATPIRYAIRYEMSGVLLKDGETYTLDHDFAFPDRDGDIQRFSLKLALDSSWQPTEPARDVYTASNLEPGTSFVLTIPMRYSGAGTPLANDGSRSPEIQYAVTAIPAFFGLAVIALLVRESRLGRFVPIDLSSVTPDWVRTNIVAHPAEVVGAAWDASVGSEEVVALLARLTAEGTLTSDSSPSGMHLTLNVDRSELDGYERELIDGLFFDGRNSTSTSEVKTHYKDRGFNPTLLIQAGLLERLKTFLPGGAPARVMWVPSLLLFLLGYGLLVKAGRADDWNSPAPIIIGVVSFILAGFLQIPGFSFRGRVDWGIRAMVVCLVPAALVAAFATWYLWYRVGSGITELPVDLIAAIGVLAIWLLNTSINGIKSRQSREGVAFRKRLTAGRLFFRRELEKDNPALDDNWYPWILAFGLEKEADAWSVQHPQSDDRRGWRSSSSSSTSSSSSSGGGEFSGWSGGRSGGAGASASWATAAAGMAAGVSAPRSSSSSGGGSSSGGSSGGGGGGGW